MIDFIRCLQNRKLLETGDYMVISVDDEIYDPTKRLSIIERGKHEHNIYPCLTFNYLNSIINSSILHTKIHSTVYSSTNNFLYI